VININDFTYPLPEERIALHPLRERDHSKLLIYKDGSIAHSEFNKIINFIPSYSILFFNNTKVIPARLFFQKETGAAIEIFLLNPVWPSPIVSLAMSAKGKSRWHCAIGNLKRWKENSKLQVVNSNLRLDATLIDKRNTIVELAWSPETLNFSEIVQTVGNIPLPPYIKRKLDASDRERYQTIYSTENGAVAAPTAGLHFTEYVFNTLNQNGITSDYLTLHVSAGTFQPVKVENATEHTIHAEQIIITRKNIENLIINKKIIAVGTTSLRTIESLYWYGVKLLHDQDAIFIIRQGEGYHLGGPSKTEALNAILKKMDSEKADQVVGETSIYILPGYRFQIVDALITNFHQPSSTLILLVAAFVGNHWRVIYEAALSNGYRFLSYGDSSLLFRNQF
jgi:S-adenosylmethionine:tRNA ribosyltransferase-isomerase